MIVEGDLEFEGTTIHYWEGGSGRPLLLLHGSGPGASTQGNWRLVLEPLSRQFRVLAGDLIGFGRSGRKAVPPFFDFALWERQARVLLDRIGSDDVGILGHSISGALALKLAATDPRVSRVMTTGAMGARFTVNPHTVQVWTFPETREDMRRTAECLVFDHSVITDAYLDGRMQVLQSPGYAEYFRSMFSGDRQRFADAAILTPEELARIRCPVMMVHGRDDRPFPYEETTARLAKSLPQADVVALGRCAHSPAVEQPETLLRLAAMHFG